MFGNYLTIAFRRLLRNRVHSLINIGGLAIGFAAVAVIGMFVNYELSYNKWLPEIDRLYKVEFTETEPGHEPILSAMTPAPLAAALVKDYSGIEQATRLKTKTFSVRQQSRKFNEEIYFVDPNFFEVFDLQILEGDRASVLATSSGIAISERTALKYFGDRSPIGEVLEIGAGVSKSVAAVFANTPRNSHLNPNFITKISENASGLLAYRNSWGSDQAHTYLKVKASFDPMTIEQNGRAFAERNISLTWTKLPPADLHHYNLIPVADIHLHSNKDNHEQATGDFGNVVTFAVVAVLILALAAINFTNLSTAQAIKSAREVALRKILGAHRRQLVVQFLGEAMLTTVFALAIGLTIAELLLPFFSGFLDKELTMAPLVSFPIASMAVVLVLLTGLGGGLYPAIVLSGFRPATILRANQSNSDVTPWFRNILVILQFGVSIALIAATGIIYKQTDYTQSVELGFEPAGKILIPVYEQSARTVSSALSESFRNIPGVETVSYVSADLPGMPHGLGVFMPPGSTRDEARSITRVFTDAHFFSLMGLDAVAGRLFSESRRADFRNIPEDTSLPITRSAVLNQAAVKLLGFHDEVSAIGQQLTVPTGDRPTIATIVGVVPDVHLGSLHKAIEPIVFHVTDSSLSYLMLDIGGANPQSALQEIETVWQKHVPSIPINIKSLEEAYATLYLDAERQGLIFAAFSAFAVFIACIGLYGLASHMAQRRTKEIGVRKVVGATVIDIVALLTWQFTKLVIVAAPIGILASIWGMQEWLTNFAYRISLYSNFWVFVAAAVIAFVIAWLTVGGNAAKVARMNPIKALRYE